MSGGVAGRSWGGLVAVLGDLGVVLGRLGTSWCGLCAVLRGLGASSGGLGAILARLEGQKMARRRFEDLRAARSAALGDPISNDYFILLND